MTWRHVSTETTTAERNLWRTDSTSKYSPWGVLVADKEGPSIGGYVETTHYIWRCRGCSAWAVTSGENPGKCEKCK